MTVGTDLRQARERAGLSIDEIGRRTKIQRYKIEALEQGDYDRLPQGIYLDGIVRSYCHEVMVDPEPMVNRVRLERGKRPGDSEVPFSAPIDLHGPAKPREVEFIDVPEIDDQLGSFVTEKRSPVAPVPRAPIAPIARVAPIPPVASVPPVAPIPPVARVAPVAPEPIAPVAPAPVVSVRPVARRRMGALLPAIIVLTTAFLGGYLYQSWRLHERSDARMSTTESIAPNEITPNETPAPSPDAAQPLNDPPKAVASPVVQPDKVATSGLLPNVAGSWKLNTKVESSSYSRFAGLQLGYELRLAQKGERITGVGRKVAENGTPINKRAQTPLSVTGTINGDRLTLNFVERGARRPSRGKFVLLLDDGETLRGRFSSSAARSAGIVEAHRLPTP